MTARITPEHHEKVGVTNQRATPAPRRAGRSRGAAHTQLNLPATTHPGRPPPGSGQDTTSVAPLSPVPGTASSVQVVEVADAHQAVCQELSRQVKVPEVGASNHHRPGVSNAVRETGGHSGQGPTEHQATPASGEGRSGLGKPGRDHVVEHVNPLGDPQQQGHVEAELVT